MGETGNGIVLDKDDTPSGCPRGAPAFISAGISFTSWSAGIRGTFTKKTDYFFAASSNNCARSSGMLAIGTWDVGSSITVHSSAAAAIFCTAA